MSRKATQNKVWHIYQFVERYEIPAYVQGYRKGPMLYVKDFVGISDDISYSYHRQMEELKAKENRDELFFCYSALRNMAASMSVTYRGYLLDGKMKPASTEHLNKVMQRDNNKLAAAVLRTLKRIGLLEQVEMPDFENVTDPEPKKKPKKTAKKPAKRKAASTAPRNRAAMPKNEAETAENAETVEVPEISCKNQAPLKNGKNGKNEKTTGNGNGENKKEKKNGKKEQKTTKPEKEEKREHQNSQKAGKLQDRPQQAGKDPIYPTIPDAGQYGHCSQSEHPAAPVGLSGDPEPHPSRGDSPPAPPKAISGDSPPEPPNAVSGGSPPVPPPEQLAGLESVGGQADSYPQAGSHISVALGAVMAGIEKPLRIEAGGVGAKRRFEQVYDSSGAGFGKVIFDLLGTGSKMIKGTGDRAVEGTGQGNSEIGCFASLWRDALAGGLTAEMLDSLWDSAVRQARLMGANRGNSKCRNIESVFVKIFKDKLAKRVRQRREQDSQRIANMK